MSEAKTLRLSKVTKEFNCSLKKITEILQEHGFTVECNPNAKIGSEEYEILQRFSGSKIAVDGIVLDQANLEFNQAVDFVTSTNQIVFLTGRAGTGKTTFLKYIKSVTKKNTVVVAPTGVAAINAGGVTMHSFFQLPFGPVVPSDPRLRTQAQIGDEDRTTIYSSFRFSGNKRKIIQELELLIIDEISMVRCDILDVIDRLLRVFRSKPSQPFGGVQVILIGDVFQLPPVANNKNNEWQILSQFYKSRYFFSSKIMLELIRSRLYVHFELKKIYRQNEQEFIDLLNRVRVNQPVQADFELLNSKVNPIFSPTATENYIILSTTNKIVNATNGTKLDELKNEARTFPGTVTGTFPTDQTGQFILPAEMHLILKDKAQVMMLKNDLSPQKRFFNGKIGKVSSLDDDKIAVQFTNGTEVLVQKATWRNIEYIWNEETKKVEEKEKGTFTQYPLKLAWAITVHKSQGLTFEKVIADLGGAFEDGQVYVALSRCATLSGLILRTEIPPSAIRASEMAVAFSTNETPETLLLQQLSTGKADFNYQKARESLENGNFEDAFDWFLKAIQFRNDIQTTGFKRYLKVMFSKLFSYKRANNKLILDLFSRKEELIELHEEMSTLKMENKKYLGEIKLLRNEVIRAEGGKDQADHQLINLKGALEQALNRIQFLQADSKAQNGKVHMLEKKILSQEAELMKERNTKWYQKIFTNN